MGKLWMNFRHVRLLGLILLFIINSAHANPKTSEASREATLKPTKDLQVSFPQKRLVLSNPSLTSPDSAPTSLTSAEFSNLARGNFDATMIRAFALTLDSPHELLEYLKRTDLDDCAKKFAQFVKTLNAIPSRIDFQRFGRFRNDNADVTMTSVEFRMDSKVSFPPSPSCVAKIHYSVGYTEELRKMRDGMGLPIDPEGQGRHYSTFELTDEVTSDVIVEQIRRRLKFPARKSVKVYQDTERADFFRNQVEHERIRDYIKDRNPSGKK